MCNEKANQSVATMTLIRTIINTEIAHGYQSDPCKKVTYKVKDITCIMQRRGNLLLETISNQTSRNTATIFVSTASYFFPRKQQIAKIS